MKKYYFFYIIFIVSRIAYGGIFPSELSSTEREEVLPYYLNSYSQQVSSRPYFIGNYPGFEIGSSVSYRSLADLQEFFIDDNIRDNIVTTQIYIKKSLVHRISLTISSSLSSFGTTQISGFGGILSWDPVLLSDMYITPTFAIFTNSMNYEDALAYQDSGLQLGLGKNFRTFSFKSGISLSQLNGRFSGQINDQQITSSGRTEKTKVFLQTYFLSTQVDFRDFLISITQNYTVNAGWNPSFLIAYKL